MKFFFLLEMGREKLIHLALLTGSDYTEGIQGVGPVCALEILAEFPSDGLEALERFRDWLSHVQSKKNAPPENKIRQKIRNLSVNPGKFKLHLYPFLKKKTSLRNLHPILFQYFGIIYF